MRKNFLDLNFCLPLEIHHSITNFIFLLRFITELPLLCDKRFICVIDFSKNCRWDVIDFVIVINDIFFIYHKKYHYHGIAIGPCWRFNLDKKLEWRCPHYNEINNFSCFCLQFSQIPTMFPISTNVSNF